MQINWEHMDKISLETGTDLKMRICILDKISSAGTLQNMLNSLSYLVKATIPLNTTPCFPII